MSKRPFTARNDSIQLSSGQSDKESLLGLKIQLSKAAEDSDVIEVTAQIVDNANAPVALAWECLIELVDGNADATNPGSAFEMDVTTGTGITAGTQDRMLITSDASGAIVVDVTDVAAASGATIHGLARRTDGYAAPARIVITFD